MGGWVPLTPPSYNSSRELKYLNYCSGSRWVGPFLRGEGGGDESMGDSSLVRREGGVTQLIHRATTVLQLEVGRFVGTYIMSSTDGMTTDYRFASFLLKDGCVPKSGVVFHCHLIDTTCLPTSQQTPK